MSFTTPSEHDLCDCVLYPVFKDNDKFIESTRNLPFVKSRVTVPSFIHKSIPSITLSHEQHALEYIQRKGPHNTIYTGDSKYSISAGCAAVSSLSTEALIFNFKVSATIVATEIIKSIEDIANHKFVIYTDSRCAIEALKGYTDKNQLLFFLFIPNREMRLLISLGLTLLIGGTWAQHSFITIDSATDLLALPSDHHTDTDIEQESVESIAHMLPSKTEDFSDPNVSTFNLPFGVRLPGYEQIQYAYGYQIPVRHKAQTVQSVSLPRNILVTNAPAIVDRSSDELKAMQIVTKEPATPTTDLVEKITSSLTTNPTNSWLNSTYFPQFLDLSLSPPRVELVPAAKITQPTESHHQPELKVKTETVLPSLQTGYLPPEIEFPREQSPPPPAPPNSYLPPNPDPGVEMNESEGFVLKSDPLLNIAKTDANPPLPESSYLPPKPSSTFKAGKNESSPPLVETSYLPPKPDSILKVDDKSDHPLPDNSYLPPKTDFAVKENPSTTIPDINLLPEQVTENQVTSLPPNENTNSLHEYPHGIPNKPLILVPISSLPNEVIEEQEYYPLRFAGENRNPPPTGVIGEQEDHPVRFAGGNRNPPPTGVIGEHQDHPVRFVGENRNPPPTGVIGEHQDHPVRFAGGNRNPPPTGVIGEHQDHPVRFVGENRNPPPTGVIGEQDHHVRFVGENRNPPPTGVIGEQQDHPVRFVGENRNPPPTGVIGEHQDHPVRFVGENRNPPPTGVIGEHQDHPVRFVGENRNPPPTGVIGEQEDHPVRFVGENRNPPPNGVIGEQEDHPVRFVGENRNPPPTGVIGEQDHPVRFVGENRNPPPTGVIGEQQNHPVRFVGENRNPPPTGVIGEQKDHPVRFVGENRNPPPTGVIGEQQDHPVRFVGENRNPPPTGVIGEQDHLPVRFVGENINRPPTGVTAESKAPLLKFVVGHINPEKIKPIREHTDIPPLAVVTETETTVIRAHAKQPSLHPIGVISETTDNSVKAHGYPKPVVVAATPKDNAVCTQNHDCNEEEICMDGICINACIIATGLCIGNAFCHAKQHIPGCVCPDMFIAVTLKGNKQDQYDCMPMMMMGIDSNRRHRITQGSTYSGNRYPQPIANHHQNFNFISLPPIGVLTERGISQGRITTSGIRQNSFSGDACSPSPCGPNTRCQVSPRGIALCRCLDDFVPDGNTINGCKPQCTIDDDCPDDYRCRATKCVRVCVQGACGTNADCDSRNHRPICKCPNGYRGDPHITCSRDQPEVKVAPPAPPLDPCSPNPCGIAADCRTRGDRPVCTCPIGYEGDPLVNCRRGECIETNDCPSHRVCQKLRCIDPCQEGICGSGSECVVRNHQPICSCPRGFTGDPFVNCRRFDPQELCNPTPCGRNTNCKVRNERAVCSCIDNYIGNPLTGCRPECVSDADCPGGQLACRNNICVNPCRDACGEGAYCDVRNGRAICSCPEFYQGDAYSRCYAECTAHDDCPSYQACFQLKCVDPCEGACGQGANCKVDDHKPICSCPKGYTGHPFDSCRPFTPEDLCNPNPCGTQADCTPGFDSSGNDRPVCTCPVGYIGNPLIACQRGECQDHNQCRDHEACYAYTCQNPCYTDVGSVCGENAQCNVKNHQPVCSCPPGYDGNPLTECRIGRRGSITAGRIRRK
ncbi:uncharacterized protein [Palaemon carinicauda]|uniref:uncharacterized protein n=1 Tax=Palaemon carinicauda TaxID=392227 RepID=UPI0035B5972F